MKLTEIAQKTGDAPSLTSELCLIAFPVQETFQQTIQGEGYWNGVLVDFIRLYGCPVNCSWCDQEYGDGGKHLPRSRRSISEMMAELKSPRVVISGGEPTIHNNLLTLIAVIEASDRQVSIETAGVKWHSYSSETWITLSPKEHINPQAKVKQNYWRRANEVKIVVTDGSEYDYYNRGNLLQKPWKHIYLQPNWENQEVTIPLTLELLRKHPTVRLSLQTHKYIGVL